MQVNSQVRRGITVHVVYCCQFHILIRLLDKDKYEFNQTSAPGTGTPTVRVSQLPADNFHSDEPDL
jgi:hypothetical protein